MNAPYNLCPDCIRRFSGKLLLKNKGSQECEHCHAIFNSGKIDKNIFWEQMSFLAFVGIGSVLLGFWSVTVAVRRGWLKCMAGIKSSYRKISRSLLAMVFAAVALPTVGLWAIASWIVTLKTKKGG